MATGKRASSPVWDTHAHIFAGRDEYSRDPRRTFDPPDGTLDEYIGRYRDLHERIGVTHGVLIQSNVYGEDNSVTKTALRRLGSNYCGIALLRGDETVEELRDLDDAGFRGCRLNLRVPGQYRPTHIVRHATVFRNLRWHIEVLCEPASYVKYADILAAADVPIVLDHHGFGRVDREEMARDFQLVLGALRSGAIWIKVSAPYRISSGPPPYRDTVATTIALLEANPDQIVWGSDWPHINYNGRTPDTEYLFSNVRGICETRGIWGLVARDNPHRLYGSR